jgi:hypothetical protein
MNAYRPGTVDTGMQAWIRGRAREQIGAGLHGRFTRARRAGHLITPERFSAGLLATPATGTTGSQGAEASSAKFVMI